MSRKEAEMIEFSAEAGSLLKLIAEIAGKANKVAKAKLSRIKSERHIASLRQYITQLDQVWTLYQPDKVVSLSKIYYPLKVDLRTTVFTPQSVDDLLRDRSCVVIQGTAGQGKSLFMRNMCMAELRRGKYIPLLVKLKDLRKGEKLIALILREFSKLGFDENERLLFYFWKQGHLLLLLDGFDELNSDYTADLIQEIENYVSHYRKTTRLVISSRPNTDLSYSYYWESVDLSPLESYEQYKFVEHMMPEGPNRNAIISELRRSAFLSEFVKTPLLLTLLLVAYKSESRIPSNLVDFYRMLFPTLMYRHDGMKIGFNREIQSKIEQSKLEEVFQTFCFLCAQSQLVTFSTAKFLNLLEEVNRYSDIGIDRKEAQNIKHDIIKVTCLIVEDGFEQHSFIHKSIQEYFAATFLDRSGEELIAKFYGRLLEDFRVYQVWSQTALFLSGLNEYLFLKYFKQPLIFKFITKTANKIKKEGFVRLIGDSSRLMLTDEAEVALINIQNGYFLVMDEILVEIVIEAINQTVKANQVMLRSYIDDCELRSYETFHKGPDENVFYLKDIFDKFELWSEVLDSLNATAETRIRVIKERATAQLEKFEDRKGLMEKIRILD